MSERYELKNIEEAFSLIKDPELKKVFKKYVKDFSAKVNFSGIYTSKKEVVDGIKERVLDGFNEKYRDLKSDISQLRKRGFEVEVLDLKLLTIPLKQKMLIADFSLENYNVIFEIFNFVSEKISSLMIKLEEKEKERDENFKKKEELWKKTKEEMKKNRYEWAGEEMENDVTLIVDKPLKKKVKKISKKKNVVKKTRLKINKQ